jgi:hypothetical protein
MAYNKEKQSMKSIVFDIELEKEIQALADENERSYNAQVNYMLKQYLKLKNS